VLVDLHAHYAMHLTEGVGNVQGQLRDWKKAGLRARFVHWVSRTFNYEGPGGEAGVKTGLMHAGKVGVALSVLYVPFTEIDLKLPYGSPPKSKYFKAITDQMDLVERHVAGRNDVVCPLTTLAQLEEAVADPRKVGLVHCIEGGHVLGANAGEIWANVATLAGRGVAYVTIAHLFWRQVATNAPALPFMPDWLYRLLWRQKETVGLSGLGEAAVRAMHKHRILIDIAHMSDASIHQTLDLLDEIDRDKRVPVIASHGAYRFPRWPRARQFEYNLSDETIRRIAERKGVIGLILCKHYISHGLSRPQSFEDSMELLFRHIDRIREVTRDLSEKNDFVGIGSDLDGWIKPALPGLTHMGRMDELQDALADKYGDAEARKISRENALRVLRYRFS
jgi:microsomal dipeptidase-like Zn-dependent dipeptidase